MGTKLMLPGKKHLGLKVITNEKPISSAGGAPRISDIEPCEDINVNVFNDDDDNMDFIVNFKWIDVPNLIQ